MKRVAFMKYRLAIRSIFLGALILTALLVAYFLSISLIAFQKAAMITPADLGRFRLSSAAEVLDVRKLIAPIPYSDAHAVYDIYPEDRYRETIEYGKGNCSNLVFGEAVFLSRYNYPFQIIHFMQRDTILWGMGHTVLNMPYKLDGVVREGLVDMMEGGLPLAQGRFLDLSAVMHKNLSATSIYALNARKDNHSKYYEKFLNDSVIGVVTDVDVKIYYKFLERIHIPLPSKKLERVVFGGMAIVFDRFPRTYVDPKDYKNLFWGKMRVVFAARILVWLLRLLPLLVLLLLLTSIPWNKLLARKWVVAPVVIGKATK